MTDSKTTEKATSLFDCLFLVPKKEDQDVDAGQPRIVWNLIETLSTQSCKLSVSPMLWKRYHNNPSLQTPCPDLITPNSLCSSSTLEMLAEVALRLAAQDAKNWPPIEGSLVKSIVGTKLTTSYKVDFTFHKDQYRLDLFFWKKPYDHPKEKRNVIVMYLGFAEEE